MEQDLLEKNVTTLTPDDIQALVLSLQDQVASLDARISNQNFGSKIYQTKEQIASKGRFIAGAKDNVVILDGQDPTWRIWAGAADPASAPFRVDKAGNMFASSVTLTGYLQVGDALSDTQSSIGGSGLGAISSNLGTITAGSITAVTITGSTITGTTLSTATSGQRVVLTSTLAQFYNSSGTEIVETYASSNSYLIKGIQSASSIALDCGSSGAIVFLVNGTSKVSIDGGGVWPTTSDVSDLGNISKKWRDVWNTGTHIYRGIDMPVVYFGYVSGTSITEDNTSFTASNPSTGKYTITHNLGTTNYIVTATTLRGSGAGAYVCKIESRNTNDFKVTVFDDVGTVQNGDFMFIVCKI